MRAAIIPNFVASRRFRAESAAPLFVRDCRDHGTVKQPARSDLDGFAGLWIPALTRRFVLHHEAAKTAEINTLSGSTNESRDC
jgi:hypothetical protein